MTDNHFVKIEFNANSPKKEIVLPIAIFLSDASEFNIPDDNEMILQNFYGYLNEAISKGETFVSVGSNIFRANDVAFITIEENTQKNENPLS